MTQMTNSHIAYKKYFKLLIISIWLIISVFLCLKWNSTEAESQKWKYFILDFTFFLPFETPEFDPFANECPAAVHNLNRLILD